MLAFSDSRQVAARLAPNLQSYAMRDAIRPLILRGWADLAAQPGVGRLLSLGKLVLAAMVGAKHLKVRLRPELRPTESLQDLEEVSRAIDDGALDGDDEARNELLTLTIQPPQSLLRAIYATLTDRHYGLASLGLASLRERGSLTARLLADLPGLDGVAATDEQELALVRLWLAQWATSTRGIWFPSMTDGERLATAGDLNRFGEIAMEVLGAVDPALALEPDRRWAAGAFGITPPWSAQMCSSIAETIALLATQSGGDELPAGGTGQDIADAIVGEILASANADRSGQLWSSLSDVLPTLAEASPDRFLDAVDTGLDSGGLSAIFDPETEDTPFGSPTHTGLLWSLEALAWSPQHLGSAALALARQAQLDPGGRWVNRPDRSLNQIFLPWRPHTTAQPDERLAVIDMLCRRAAPDVAWLFLAGLLPTPHSISETSYQPRWREWHLDYQPRQMGVAEWLRHAKVITARLLEDAGLVGTHWADLIARLPYLPEAQHDLILDRLRTLDPAAFEETDRVAAAGALRTLVRDHRRFADAPGRCRLSAWTGSRSNCAASRAPTPPRIWPSCSRTTSSYPTRDLAT